jgi:hypothetical protein
LFGAIAIAETSSASSAQTGPEPAGRQPTSTEQLRPFFPAGARPSKKAGPDQRRQRLELREQVAARANNRAPGPSPSRPEVPGRETTLADPRRSAASSASIAIGRNHRNTVASTLSSTLAEPAAANDGLDVLYTGNTYVSRSSDGGLSWSEVSLPEGPHDAPIACCDLDVIHDLERDVTFWSVLYLDANTSNGVVGVFVRRRISVGNDCAYFVDPGGAADNVLPDYPHLGLSDKFLYVTTSNLGAKTWLGSQVRRMSLTNMANCQATPTDVFTYGGREQRVFVPVENASATMYWGALETPTSFRLFTWPESGQVVSSVVRPISPSHFENPDCRGGVGDFDFIEVPSSFSIIGFRLRGAVGGGRVTFLWNVGPDRFHPQGHVHGAVFSESDSTVVAEPRLSNHTTCLAYPVLGSNRSGDLGWSIAAGGRKGGGGPAARGFVGVDSAASGGVHFGPLALTADATHNPFNKYGDYFTVRANSRCPRTWVATNYGLVGGNTDPENVNARYIEFGTKADANCL